MKRYTLELKLKHTEISRTIAICGGLKFDELHSVIQIVFGWENYHIHSFKAGKITISSYDNYKDEDDLPLNFHEESDLAVDIIFLNMQKILYEYDYGDGWEIEIVVKQIEDIKSYECPKLLQAKGDMVIDDCGGPMGLNEIETSPADINGLNLILEETFGE